MSTDFVVLGNMTTAAANHGDRRGRLMYRWQVISGSSITTFGRQRSRPKQDQCCRQGISMGNIAKAFLISCALSPVLHVPAWADDNKEYPGVMCQPDRMSGLGDDGADPQIAYSGLTGGVVNPSAAAQTVVCPIVRDIGSTLGTTVAVRNGNDVAAIVSCEIRAYRAGAIVDRSPHDFAVGPSETRFATMALNTKVAGEPSGAGGTYALVCRLPSRINLLAYFVREQN